MTFDLNSPGIKTFGMLAWAIQNDALQKDLVALDKFTCEAFIEFNQVRGLVIKLSMATMSRGLRELEKSKIIAKSLRAGYYFINPSFVFNGDRIVFTQIIERDKRELQRLENQ